MGVALLLGAAARSAAGPAAPSFAAAKSYRTGDGPFALAVADLNGDAKPDVATVNFYSSTASVFFQDGEGSLLPRHDYRTGESPSLIAIEDLNGDAAPDLVTSSNYFVSVLLNQADGSFLPKVDYPAGGTWVEIAELNGDQRPDLVGAAASGHSVSVLLNKGRRQLCRARLCGHA